MIFGIGYLAKIKVFMIFIGGILLAIFAIYREGKSRGTQEAEQKQNEILIDDVKTSNEVEQDVQSRSDDELANDARKWL